MANVTDFRGFEELEVWKTCRELRINLEELAKKFPGEEKFRLADQIIRASRSVTNNIAEGYGRFHYQETIQFCRQSRGSLYELIDHLIICRDNSFINETVYSTHKEHIVKCITMLNGYIKYLNNKKLADK